VGVLLARSWRCGVKGAEGFHLTSVELAVLFRPPSHRMIRVETNLPWLVH
jgi:hypothetical protein